MECAGGVALLTASATPRLCSLLLLLLLLLLFRPESSHSWQRAVTPVHALCDAMGALCSHCAGEHKSFQQMFRAPVCSMAASMQVSESIHVHMCKSVLRF
jgi:hypothetical protein